jgi:L-arabinose isomerase
MNAEYLQLRIGLIGLGLKAYWEQFPELQQRLTGYLDEVEARISGESRRVVNLGLVDTPESAFGVGHASRKEDIDVLVVYVTTYALSSVLLPIIRLAKVPVLLLNLQPTQAIDYSALHALLDRTAMTAEWLAYCNACPIPEFTNVLRRLNLPFFQVTGALHEDPECWIEIEEWLEAARVAKQLSHCRLGLMGHYYSGMLDVTTDIAQVSGRFGMHVELLEVDELSGMRTEVTSSEVNVKNRAFREFFDIQQDCAEDELERAAKTAVALDRFVSANALDLMAYYHKGEGNPQNEDTMSSIILGASMLTGSHVPIAGEYEVKNAIAMKIMDLFGAGGSFTEFYAIDFVADLVLMGHDGPGHFGIAQDKVKVRPLRIYHGKIGQGLSVEMAVKHGPVTLLSIAESPTHGFRLVVAEGHSVPGTILEIGNTNSCYRFSIGARRFVNEWNAEGPAHHCAIGLGHIASKLNKLASLLALPIVQVSST